MTAPMDIEGPAAPPRTNGELVFAEPWESRAFGMAVTLYEAGLFTWPQFQAALIARIAHWQAAPTEPRTGTITTTGWARSRMCWRAAGPCWPTTSPREPRHWLGGPPATTMCTLIRCQQAPTMGGH